MDNVKVHRFGSGIPLVARAEEMRRLRAAFARAEDGDANAVVIAGDAGVGKTRLITELASFANDHDAMVLTGRCLDVGESGLPYLAFAEALSLLEDSTDEVAAKAVQTHPALGRLLPQVAMAPASSGRAQLTTGDTPSPHGLRTEQDLGQLQLFSAVLETLSEISEHRTVMLVIEDLHWADGATRDLLSFLLSRLRLQRLLIVMSYRGEDVHRRHPLRGLMVEFGRLPVVTQLELHPLAEEDARTFVQALVVDTKTPEAIDRVVKRSEGNPFFAEELVASDGGLGEGSLKVPARLAEVLLTRQEKLSEPAKKVLRVASVSDGLVTDQEIAELTQLDEGELEDALREVVQHHVLVIERGNYSFRHALLRETVYADLLPRECARLHSAYAARLKSEPNNRGHNARLAYHSLRSRDFPTAIAALLEAAEEAEELGAPGAALSHIEQALENWDMVTEEAKPQGIDEIALLHEASHLAGLSGDPERAIAYARSAVQGLSPGVAPERAARVWRRLAESLLSRDNTFEEAIQAIEQSWAFLEDAQASPVRAWVLATRAMILRMAGRNEDALFSANTAVADAHSVGADGAEAFALITIGAMADAVGDAELARKNFREAERKAVEAGSLDVELRSVYFQAFSYEDQAEIQQALKLYRRGAARAKESGLNWSSWGLESKARSLMLRYISGDWPDTTMRDHPGRGVSDAVSARLAAEWVSFLVARGQFEDAAKLFPGLKSQWHLELQIPLTSEAARISQACWQGDYGLAVQLTRECIEWLQQYDPWILAGIRFAALGVSAAVAQISEARVRGDEKTVAQAEIAGNEFYQHAQKCLAVKRPRSGTLGPEGQAWRKRLEAAMSALLGANDPDLWTEAVAAFDYGAVYEQALCRWHCAEAFLEGQSPDFSQAAQQLTLAYETAEQLDARPLLEALRDLARRARIDLPGESASTKRDPEVLLTGREQSVLELVALGRTNRQVGAELYISEKTVSVHLSRVMAKLGAARRAEAVAIAYAQGLLTKPSASSPR